jgi:hypothetical protein
MKEKKKEIHGKCNVVNSQVPFEGGIPHNPTMAVPSVGLDIIRDVTQNFSNGNIIGQGGFSVVYKVSSSFKRLFRTL